MNEPDKLHTHFIERTNLSKRKRKRKKRAELNVHSPLLYHFSIYISSACLMQDKHKSWTGELPNETRTKMNGTHLFVEIVIVQTSSGPNGKVRLWQNMYFDVRVFCDLK